MDAVSDLVKMVLVPGSAGFLLAGMTAGVVLLLIRRVERWGRRWLAALAGLYWGLSLPLVAAGLQGALSWGAAPLERAAQAQGAEAVVLLGGGSATLRSQGAEISVLSTDAGLRALEAARVWRLLGDPWIVASGGTSSHAGVVTPESLPLREALIQAGVPAERIVLESGSHDTHDQALAVAELLAERDLDGLVLVTSPDHMRRAMLAFRAAGLSPIPSPAAARSETLPPPLGLVLPSLRSLEESASALREFLGLGYYWLRGWL